MQPQHPAEHRDVPGRSYPRCSHRWQLSPAIAERPLLSCSQLTLSHSDIPSPQDRNRAKQMAKAEVKARSGERGCCRAMHGCCWRLKHDQALAGTSQKKHAWDCKHLSWPPTSASPPPLLPQGQGSRAPCHDSPRALQGLGLGLAGGVQTGSHPSRPLPFLFQITCWKCSYSQVLLHGVFFFLS